MTGPLLVLAVLAAAACCLWAVRTRRQMARVRSELEAAKDHIEALEGRLRMAEEGHRRTYAILESISEGVLVVDAQQKVLIANPALCSSLGLTAERATGLSYWEALRDADLNEMILKVLTDKVPQQREHTPPLSEAVFEVRISPVFGGREFLGAAAVLYDVTRLKQLERSRSEFVANVSHELKTPLTSIIGFVETLKEGAIDDTENRMRFLGIIEEHAQKLHRLIEDLLHLSRIESRDTPVLPEPVDLDRILQGLATLFEKQLRTKQVRMRWEVDPKPFIFRADPKAIEQVFSNLIDNAIKYNEAGGEVLIRASREGGVCRFEVRDTGIGIPEADLPRVFERFYRVEKSRSRELGGTGLGLSIVKHLIEKHGGRIEALPDPSGKGTLVRFFLPA